MDKLPEVYEITSYELFTLARLQLLYMRLFGAQYYTLYIPEIKL